MNTTKVSALICVELFYQKGGRTVVISPGSRNAPLTIAFQKNANIECIAIPDERSAGFFAMGLAKARDEKVALVCTSGTALLNYYPAIMEANFQGIPLIVISADRPESLIGQGVGQSIQQKEVFGDSVRKFVHINDELNSAEEAWYANRQINEAINASSGKNAGPIHINLGFSESLYLQDDVEPNTDFYRNIVVHTPASQLPAQTVKEIVSNWKSAKRKMILCGMLENPNELEEILTKLESNSDVVILHESTSNLSSNLGISTIDRVLQLVENDESCQPELLLTVGKHVISKRIKSFLKKAGIKKHWSIIENGETIDTFQSLSDIYEVSATHFLEPLTCVIEEKKSYQEKWYGLRSQSILRHEHYLEKVDFSDLAAFSMVLSSISDTYHLELANSSVIRYAQLFPRGNWKSSSSNRGTSGIEGSTSTAVGYCLGSKQDTLLITGDVSFFYDSNGLWNDHVPSNFRIIVLNNGGGGIFRFIEGPSTVENHETFFESAHNLSVKGIAQTFGLDYSICDSEASLKNELPEFLSTGGDRPKILEVKTPRIENDKVLKSYFHYIANGE